MHSTRHGVVYVVTNDPVPNGNAVLTYLNDGAANLSPLPSSQFNTNGTGYTTKHVLPHFGPFDPDQNLMLSADAHRLFVTNGGSDSIAVFDMFDDGSLQRCPARHSSRVARIPSASAWPATSFISSTITMIPAVTLCR